MLRKWDMGPMGEVVRWQGGRVSDRVGKSFGEVVTAAQAGAGWAAGRLWASLPPAVAG